MLVHLGAGLGNVIQATPMIKCLSRAGFTIDLCIQADYGDVPDLFRDWQAVRAVSSSGREFTGNTYDYYIIGICVTADPVRFKNFDAAVSIRLDYSHRDISHVSEAGLYLNVARMLAPGIEAGYKTYCGKSSRDFPEISPATCVLAPGGKFGFAIKKWDRYDLLAERLGDVAVLGIEKDMDISNARTFPGPIAALAKGYLNHRTFVWRVLKVFSRRTSRRMRFGREVKNYLGRLSLPDTAALINRAGFFIGNDCGLAHVSVAMGKPTFVLVGPTSVKKNFARFKNVYPISLDHECAPCQEKTPELVMRSSHARHFCPYGIRCLRDMEVNYVLRRVKSILLEKHGIEIPARSLTSK